MIKKLIMQAIEKENLNLQAHKQPFELLTDKVDRGNTYRNIDVSCYTRPSILSKFPTYSNSYKFLKDMLIIRKQMVQTETLLDILEEYDTSTMYGIMVRLPDDELLNVMYYKNIPKFLQTIETNPHIKSWEVQTFEYVNKDILDVLRGVTKDDVKKDLRDLMVSGLFTESITIASSYTDTGIDSLNKFKNKLNLLENYGTLTNHELLYYSQDPKEIQNKEILISVDKIVGDMLLPYYGAIALTTSSSTNNLLGRNLSYNFWSGNIQHHYSNEDLKYGGPYIILEDGLYRISHDDYIDEESLEKWFYNNYTSNCKTTDIHHILNNINDYIINDINRDSLYGDNEVVSRDNYSKVFTNAVCMGTNSASLEHAHRLKTLNSTSTFYSHYLGIDFYTEATQHQKCSQRILKKARAEIKENKDKENKKKEVENNES